MEIKDIVEESEFWDKSNLIGEFKDGQDLVKVHFNERNSKKSLSIRRYYQTESGEYNPTRKGLSVGVENLANLQEAIEYVIDNYKE